MFWIAEKQNGEIIALSETEALTHFERNNRSQRMRLKFIGVTDGKHQEEAKKEIQKMVTELRPEGYNLQSKEQQKLIDYHNRTKIQDDAKVLLDEAFKKEIEEARKNGVKPPRQSLHWSTPRGDRDKILRKKGLSG